MRLFHHTVCVKYLQENGQACVNDYEQEFAAPIVYFISISFTGLNWKTEIFLN